MTQMAEYMRTMQKCWKAQRQIWEKMEAIKTWGKKDKILEEIIICWNTCNCFSPFCVIFAIVFLIFLQLFSYIPTYFSNFFHRLLLLLFVCFFVVKKHKTKLGAAACCLLLELWLPNKGRIWGGAPCSATPHQPANGSPPCGRDPNKRWHPVSRIGRPHQREHKPGAQSCYN